MNCRRKTPAAALGVVCELFLFLELFKLRLESLESFVVCFLEGVGGFGSHQFAAVGGEQNQHVFIVGCFGLDYLKSYVETGDGAETAGKAVGFLVDELDEFAGGFEVDSLYVNFLSCECCSRVGARVGN